MAITQVPLSGTLNNAGFPTASPGDLAASGTLRFTLLGSMSDATGNIVAVGAQIAAPIIAGHYDITVYATDAPGVAYYPSGAVYEIEMELVVGSTPVVLTWGRAAVPASLAGGGFGLDDLVPIIPVTSDLAAHVANTAIHSGGRELGYVESTLDSGLIASTTAGFDIPGMAVNVLTTGKPVSFAFGGHVYDTVVNPTTSMILLEDGVQIAGAIDTLGAIATIACVQGYRTRTPAPGNHVYKLQLSSLTTGHTMHCFGGPASPTYLSIRENP